MEFRSEKISPEVLKKLNELDSRKPPEECVGETENTHRTLSAKLETNRFLINKNLSEIRGDTTEEENDTQKKTNGKIEGKNELMPEGEKEIRKILEKLIQIEHEEANPDNTQVRMYLLEQILQKELDATLPHVLEIMHTALEKMEVEEGKNKKTMELIMQLSNILLHMVQNYQRKKDIQFTKKSPQNQVSFKNLPGIIDDFRASDRLTKGIDIFVKLLRIDNRLLRYQIACQVLPVIAPNSKYFHELLSLRIDKQIGPVVTDILKMARDAIQSNKKQGRPTTRREEEAATLTSKFLAK